MKNLLKLLLVAAAALSLTAIHATAGYHSTTAFASNGSNDQSGFNINIPNGGAAGYTLMISGFGYVSASVSGPGLSLNDSLSAAGWSGNGGAVGAGLVSSTVYASATPGSSSSAMAWVSW